MMYPYGYELCESPKKGDVLICSSIFDKNVVLVSKVVYDDRIGETQVWGNWYNDSTLTGSAYHNSHMPIGGSSGVTYHFIRKGKKKKGGFGKFIEKHSL